MNYETVEFSGEYNSQGGPIYKGIKSVTQTFDETTLEKTVNSLKKVLDDTKNAILSAETNIELNKGILDFIKNNETFTDKEISAGSIYFKSIKDLKDMKDYLVRLEEECADWGLSLSKLKELNIPHATPTETNKGTEATSESETATA